MDDTMIPADWRAGLLAQNTPALTRLRTLVGALRPAHPDDVASALARVDGLAGIFETNALLRAAARDALRALFAGTRHVSLYVDAGMLPQTGMLAESTRRLMHKLLPDVCDPSWLRDALGLLFDAPGDERWVAAVDDAAWLRLLRSLHLDEPADDADCMLPPTLAEVLKALRILSVRIAASGVDAELMRVDPTIEEIESPFVALDLELVGWLERYHRHWIHRDAPAPDDRHLRVLHDQSVALIDRVRRRAARDGTSVRLTFLLQRLRRHLRRFLLLLDVASARLAGKGVDPALPACIPLFKTVLIGEARKNSLRHYWQQMTGLLALRVTDNAARAGEHYITETRSEYWGMWRSALGAGPIIAIMAMIKIRIALLHLPPLTEALLFCLNYGLGFVLIHMLHLTVATKQPSMTAAAIAGVISGGADRARDLDNVAALVARTVRSQIAAILGNVGLAIPTAMLIAWAVQALTGTPFIDSAKADHLLADVHPLASGALVYAGVAGVCLFLSGLISGFYDNVAAFNRVPERLRQLGWLNRRLGAARVDRIARYVDDHLGALAGNFAFGFLLGGTTALGALFGLPLDIRHIAFSSAFVGYAAVAHDFAMTGGAIAWAAAGVAGIGFMNLTVSFALALRLAFSARQVSLGNPMGLVRAILHRLRNSPREFLLPPRALEEPRGG
jgi:site-specific recombinase